MLQITLPADRKTALSLAEKFQPKMGKRYASGRNYDKGPGRHSSVSNLSPYIRRRIITEEEVVQLALDAHGLDGAEKFIQEVFWRSYFKGWLERRPSIWTEYQTNLEVLKFALDDSRRMRRDYDAATQGRTGIDCFDAWVEELVDTGYLHNHARMWFASIWIFTLQLPWELGADFFYQNLLDGDPASNTCSWRWVAGIHTLGKTYEAKAWNIEKFTEGRFHPSNKDLAVVTGPVDPDAVLPEAGAIRPFLQPEENRDSVLLLTEEDLSADLSQFSNIDFKKVIAVTSSDLRGESVNPLVSNFEIEAVKDAAKRLEETGLPEAKIVRITDLKPEIDAIDPSLQLVSGFLPTGPMLDWINANSVKLTEVKGPWDDLTWPHATAGFFKVKKQIPKILTELNML